MLSSTLRWPLHLGKDYVQLCTAGASTPYAPGQDKTFAHLPVLIQCGIELGYHRQYCSHPPLSLAHRSPHAPGLLALSGTPCALPGVAPSCTHLPARSSLVFSILHKSDVLPVTASLALNISFAQTAFFSLHPCLCFH